MNQKNEINEIGLLLDEPTDDPLLGFKDYARQISNKIAKSEGPITVGIFGDWGSGKTTLMQAIEGELKSEGKRIPTSWFDSWKYQNEDDLTIPFVYSLVKGKKKGSKVKRSANKIAKALSLIGSDIFLKWATHGQYGVSEVKARLSDVEELMDNIPGKFDQVEEDIKEIIKELKDGKDKLVIFIDDLDRCHPPKRALKILESLKVFFFVEGCIFIIGISEKRIADAYEEEYGTSKKERDEIKEEGRRYLEKIINVYYPIRKVTDEQIDEFLNHIQKKNTIKFSYKVRKIFKKIFVDCTPRLMKRIINDFIIKDASFPKMPHYLIAISSVLEQKYGLKFENIETIEDFEGWVKHGEKLRPKTTKEAADIRSLFNDTKAKYKIEYLEDIFKLVEEGEK